MESTVTHPQRLRALYPLYQWTIYLPVCILATVIGALFAVPIGYFISPRWANLHIAVWWARLLTRLSGARVVVTGADHVQPGQSYVVVANHQSAFDIPVIYGYSGLDLRWVMKAEIKWIPFVAAGCRAIGHVFVERGNTQQSTQAINQAVSRLMPGTGVLFFPEGTRSLDGALLPFKKGAFRLAQDQKLPVLPVTVKHTRDVVPPKKWTISPRTVELEFHPPIPPEQGDEHLTELMVKARSAIEHGLL